MVGTRENNPYYPYRSRAQWRVGRRRRARDIRRHKGASAYRRWYNSQSKKVRSVVPHPNKKQKKRKPVYRRGVPVVKGRIQGDPTSWLRTPLMPMPEVPAHVSVFRRGSSMVGSPGPRKLLLFRPTKEMQAKGFLPLDLRFYSVKEAERLGLDFTTSPRQDWIRDTMNDLKRLGLL